MVKPNNYKTYVLGNINFVVVYDSSKKNYFFSFALKLLTKPALINFSRLHISGFT